MTREEFALVLSEIDGAYNTFNVTEKMTEVWYKFLGSFPEDIFHKVVSDYIKENSRPPAISDFYGRCDKISGFREQMNK